MWRTSRWHWLLAIEALLGAELMAQASPRRLGVFLWHDSPNDIATLVGIKQGLGAAGLLVEFVERRANADPELARTGLDQLAAASCELVFALGTQSALLAKERLRDLPVVFAAVSNPVTSGVVADWRGSGSKLCGASNWIHPGNVLDVFRLAVPSLQRLGILRSRPSGVVSQAELVAMQEHLRQPGAPAIELFEAIAADAADLPRGTRELLAHRVDAIWIPIDLTVYQEVPAIERALGSTPVPLLTTAAAGVRSGALVGAAVDYQLHGRRAAALALDVLVRGRDPGTMPVDRMRSNLVIVNLGAARRNRTELPLSLLALADELIAAETPDVERR